MAFLTELKSDTKFIIAVLVLCLCNLLIYKTILFHSNKNPDSFNGEFPSQIADWIAKDVLYDENVIAALNPDKTIYRNYYKNENPAITLFIACYNTVEKADLSHSPIVCFTGQGWDITETNTEKIDIGSIENNIVKINQIVQKKADTTMITFYWYQSKDRAFNNRGLQKLYLFLERLLGKSEKNAFVRLTVTIPGGMSNGKAHILLDEFTKKLYPVLREYFI
ncbi:MAG: EpsI family protein [Deltaproteobacteria bacterium]|nr:EpsI family protein [Deltaproteobacteria bacterium]